MGVPMKLQNFIDGAFSDTKSYIASADPSTGKTWVLVPDSGETEVEAAVKAAKVAFKTWSLMPVEQRAQILLKVADLIEAQLDKFASAESQDQGKPLWMAKATDIPRAVKNFRHFATSAQHDTGLCKTQPEGVMNYTMDVPVGVVGVIVPWNLPLYLLTYKLAPALIYGNTVVAKPSEFTSVTSWMLCSVLQEAGLPPGVVNVVFGYGHKAGEALITHPSIRAISFTGSTKTGTRIMAAAAPMAKKISLEMGGKNAAVVFDDADLGQCISTLIRGSFFNQGQVCLATSRIYVQENIYSSFLEGFVEQAKKLRVGVPTDNEAFLGPVVSEVHWKRIKEYLKLAGEEGAKVLCGGQYAKPDLPEENQEGYYLMPTVLTNLADNTRCMQEEIFGPVTCIVPFKTEEEVVARANGVQYGLCASLWSQNVNRIHSVAQKLEAGTIWCNCWLIRDLTMPFGGMKMSGLGREGTLHSREFYTEVKTICIKHA